MRRFFAEVLRLRTAGYCAAVLGVSVVVVALLPYRDHFRGTPGIVFLLVIVFVATGWGSTPALFASLISLFALSYFFLPPYKSLYVAEPRHLFTVLAFAATALTVGQLSARARRRTEEAEQAKCKIEGLYSELQSAFDQASKAEAFRRSELFKSALLDAVTHDLQTPLTSIKLAATTLLRDENLTTGLGEAPRELLDLIDEETDRLNRFISNLVMMARVEAGQLHLKPLAAAANDIVSQALERMSFPDTCSRVRLRITEGLPPVQADPRAVAQVVYTLLENAYKHGFPDTPILLSASRGNNGDVQFAVEDQGPGIESELRERVFDKFYRVEDAVARRHRTESSGSGMGLAIARGIVQAHNGNIWIEEAESRQGTRVVFTLPVAVA